MQAPAHRLLDDVNDRRSNIDNDNDDNINNINAHNDYDVIYRRRNNDNNNDDNINNIKAYSNDDVNDRISNIDNVTTIISTLLIFLGNLNRRFINIALSNCFGTLVKSTLYIQVSYDHRSYKRNPSNWV